MDLNLCLGGIRIGISSEKNLEIDEALADFTDPAGADPDVRVRITWDFASVPMPREPRLGEDLLCYYYRLEDRLVCYTRGGPKGPVGCAYYDESCRDILLAVNDEPFLIPTTTMGKILRMLPMRAIFRAFGVTLFHASQISYGGRGLLFTAPSGTGKTTQARLWQKFRGADIVCNDRTLVRKQDGVWQTYGYPLDGSEPVRSTQVNRLGAIVLLAQGEENRVERLRPGRAAARLMGQTVMDVWDPAARKAALEQIFEIWQDIPVYRLTCTPDEEAVEALEEILKKDRVIPLDENI